jgi:hypothetical protein
MGFNPLNTELNPICHLLALLGTDPILHISRIRVNSGLEGVKRQAINLRNCCIWSFDSFENLTKY